jgi:hypothetical protein
MPRMFVLSMLAMAASVLSNAASYPTTRRDKALEGIKACEHRNVSSHRCKHLNQYVQTLVGVYRGGDKSVLPTLLQFTYLTEFYDEALLSDPENFLAAMGHLPAKDQQAVAAGIAGGAFGLRDPIRFSAIREVLRNVPQASPTKATADVSLKYRGSHKPLLFCKLLSATYIHESYRRVPSCLVFSRHAPVRRDATLAPIS